VLCFVIFGTFWPLYRNLLVDICFVTHCSLSPVKTLDDQSQIDYLFTTLISELEHFSVSSTERDEKNSILYFSADENVKACKIVGITKKGITTYATCRF
jgi:hypothetical protein